MKNIKILLINDEAIIMNGQKLLLESALNYVKTALCMKQASEILVKESPDRLITKLIMPKMSGVEVCKKIIARYPNIEPFIVSGAPDEIRKHLLDILYAEGIDISMLSPFKEERIEGENILAKSNCWEVKKCGREPGGATVDQLGVCPASVEIRLDGAHEGKNAGRACWVVAGSICAGKIQGTYAEKYKDCMECDFYMKVKSEEDGNFKMTSTLLLKLHGI